MRLGQPALPRRATTSGAPEQERRRDDDHEDAIGMVDAVADAEIVAIERTRPAAEAAAMIHPP